MTFSAAIKSNQLAIEKLKEGQHLSFFEFAKAHRFASMLSPEHWNVVTMICKGLPDDQIQYLFKTRKLCKVKRIHEEYLYWGKQVRP